MTVTVGDRVKHPTLHEQWGTGEVLAVAPDGKLTIRFARAGQKIMKGVAFEKLVGAAAADATLDNRSASRKAARKVSPLAPPLRDLKDVFLRMYPGGFADPKFREEERDYKIAAGRKLHEKLNASALATLVDAEDYQEVCSRARSVIHATNLIDHHDTIAMDRNTAGSEDAGLYAHSLRDLLHGGGAFQARFERFANVLERLSAPKWPIATYFPFLAFPTEHIFLKPLATQYVAAACGFELNYRPDLNWQTYESTLRLAESLEQSLSDLKPKDQIDLQSFIWLVWKVS